jgi:hypothetical protein
MEKSNQIQFNKLPAIFACILLLLTFLNWPYGFYTFLRIVVTGISIYYVYCLFNIKKNDFWFWSLVIIAILFNPLVPIYIGDKSIWGVIDVIVVIFFVFLINRKRHV